VTNVLEDTERRLSLAWELVEFCADKLFVHQHSVIVAYHAVVCHADGSDCHADERCMIDRDMLAMVTVALHSKTREDLTMRWNDGERT
jgi:hypothetical protein